MKDIISPVVTEKSMDKISKGIYVFEVPISANRLNIAKSVENIYHVKVDSVNIIKVKGKFKKNRVTNKLFQKRNWKKAIIRLAKGQLIKELQIKEDKKSSSDKSKVKNEK